MEGWEQPKCQIFSFNVTTIHAQHQINKQKTLLDGVGIGQLKQRVCWPGLNRSLHEAMNNISNVKVYLKTHSGNVNIMI